MFAKSIVLFFALAAFVNAAPVVDYRVDPIEFGPGPVKIQPLPVKRSKPPVKKPPTKPPTAVKNPPSQSTSSKRETSLDLDADFDFGILPGKRASIDVDLGFDGGVNIALPPLKRDTVDLDVLTNQISNLLSDEFQQGQGEVSNDIGSGSKRGLSIPKTPKPTGKPISPPKPTSKPPHP